MSDSRPSDRLRQVDDSAGRPIYYDDRSGTYYAWFAADHEPVSTALLATVSSVLGVEPTDLDALGECIDPDALNAIFVHWRGDEPRVGEGTVTFGFSRCTVTIRADGEVVIDPEDVGS